MEPTSLAPMVATLGAFASVIAAFVSGAITLRAQSAAAKESNYKRLLNLEEPLLQAAFDLQSRIANIYECCFFSFHEPDRERYRLYTEESTIYRIAQYFCYVEILRKESLYVNLTKPREIKKTLSLLHHIERAWSSDKIHGEELRIFADEQRYIGECLFCEKDGKLSCMNYRDFIKLWSRKEDVILDEIRADVRKIAGDASYRIASHRMVKVQNLLIDLIEARDNPHSRFPADKLKKIILTENAV